MDRALKIEDLNDALGQHPALTDHAADPFADVQWIEDVNPPGWPETAAEWQPALPTSKELQDLLAETEVQLFLGQSELPPRISRTAWYLHGVASASPAAEIYTVERQRRAFAISAHIFDLATESPIISEQQRLKEAFAAQVGYHRSEKEPNAVAVGRRVGSLVRSNISLLDHLPTVAIEAGVGLLGMQISSLWPSVRIWRRQFADLATDIGVDDLRSTMFGPAFCVVEGVAGLLAFLTRGDQGRLVEAQEYLDIAVEVVEGDGDHDARWVASHLRFLADEMSSGSVWNLLPIDIPDGAKQAFTLTAPSILTLWRPQRELLQTAKVSPGAAGEVLPNALDSAVKRIVLSVPTSAGKTLMSQLIMLSHLATNLTGVCYVAPQRSLGREVRRDLARRLRFISREIINERPDFGLPESGSLADLMRDLASLFPEFAGISPSQDADITVMTPEGLDRALRDNHDDVLAKYGLFIFDEAHLLAEKSRGFLLEGLLSFLHWQTRDSPHRIVLLSAAMGNAGQLAQWLRADGDPLLLQSDWRGPRRLNGIFSTEIRDWDNPRRSAVNAKKPIAHLTQRLEYDNHGMIRLRVADGQIQRVQTTESIGVSVFRATADGVRQTKTERGKGTPQYEMLAQVIKYVGHAGPVLVIRSTRRDAVQMAQAIAAGLPEDEKARAVAALAEERLGNGHRLPALLRRGVAYHHAGLPVDLQEAIEEAVRGDALRYIVATSTLTEGVNLPVRTVVLAALPYEGQPLDQQLTGARLINAMGRAGRATKESEGWVILQLAAKPSVDDFKRLEPGESELEVRSTLTESSALEALALFEAAVSSGEDAVVAARDQMADFAAFAWFVLSASEEFSAAATTSDPIQALQATLAFEQLDPEIRARYELAFSSLATVYFATDESRRRRWARTGTSVNSARLLDALAKEVAAEVAQLSTVEFAELENCQELLSFFETIGVLDELLTLPECPRKWTFHRTSSSRSPEVDVLPADLLRPWMAGVDLASIGDTVLQDIPDRTDRLEAVVLAITDFCEHFYSWMLNALIVLANDHLEGSRSLSADLPVYVRYGVSMPVAAELRVSGVRSREFATRIALAATSSEVTSIEVRQWLASKSITAWRENFGASASDVVDLLDYVRLRNSEVLRSLLSLGESTVKVILESSSNYGASESDPILSFLVSTKESLLPLAVVAGDNEGSELVATVPPALHLEIEAIIDTGLNLGLKLNGDELTIVDLGD